MYLDGVKKVRADLGFPQLGGRASEVGGEHAAVEEIMACGNRLGDGVRWRGGDCGGRGLGPCGRDVVPGMAPGERGKKVHQEVKHIRRRPRTPSKGKDRNQGRGTRILPQLPLRLRSTLARHCDPSGLTLDTTLTARASRFTCQHTLRGNHARTPDFMGFLFVPTIIFCLPYLFIILSLQRRRVYYFHVTTATTAA